MALKAKLRICVLTMAIALPALADAQAPAHSYSSGFPIVIKIGGDLAEALPDKFAKQLPEKPATTQPQKAPIICPVVVSEDNKTAREVCVSAGFVDLLNHIAHAKAADTVQPGFFDSYIQNLARTSAGQFVLPDIVDPRFWTDDVLNDQISYFNQMMSMLVAINLSHHYLGHYVKYADKMIGPNNQPVPINSLLTPGEWEVSLKAGAANSLGCALAPEGLKALFDAIGKLPERPAWAEFIVPKFADLKKTNKELDKYEHDFFHGGLN